MQRGVTKKINIGKILAIIFITVLIWVWADLALDETLPDRPATVIVDQSANPRLWVSLNQAPAVDIRVTLSGPRSAIADISRKLKKGRRLEFDFDAAQEKMTEPDNYTLTLLPFLQKNKQITRLGLRIENCEPDKLTVSIVRLVKKSLTVRCLDETATPLTDAAVEPAQVEMLVPETLTPEQLIAEVQLTRREVEQARHSPIRKTPYIKLTAGQTREAETTVEITMPPEQDLRRPDNIKNVKLGFIISPVLQGKYKVELVNLTAVMSPIAIRSTPAAKRAYENMTYHVILEIRDSDINAKPDEPIRRELVYNFPPEYIRINEIQLNQQPIIAQFRLTPLAPEQTQ